MALALVESYASHAERYEDYGAAAEEKPKRPPPPPTATVAARLEGGGGGGHVVALELVRDHRVPVVGRRVPSQSYALR